MKILNSSVLVSEIRAEIASKIASSPRKPCLGVILASDDPASQIYVKNKVKACKEVGIASITETFVNDDPLTLTKQIVRQIKDWNASSDVNGILVQLPLPEGVDQYSILSEIDPKKDVDVFHPFNVGRMLQGTSSLHPCTPKGIFELLCECGIVLFGKTVTIINASNIVGKPLAAMLTNYGATVTVCHRGTPPEVLKSFCLSSDIIVVAVGIPGFLTADMVKPNAVVIDVGISRVDGKIVGDVDFESVKEVAGAISPVPGGVGPMTVTMLLKNTCDLAFEQWQ